MKSTKIEWCDSTINPVIGCTFGCSYCYARKMNQRFGWINDFSKPQFFPERLKQLDSKAPKNIFMDSMSDVADWTSETQNKTALAMIRNSQHNYLFLTKRPLMAHTKILIIRNAWLGVSLTTNNGKKLIQELSNDIWHHKYFSIEPLHEDLADILSEDNRNVYEEWIIIGAETGNRKGKIIPKKEWIDKIVDFANMCKIPVFMKESLLPIMGEENMLREFPKELKKP